MKSGELNLACSDLNEFRGGARTGTRGDASAVAASLGKFACLVRVLGIQIERQLASNY